MAEAPSEGALFWRGWAVALMSFLLFVLRDPIAHVARNWV
jgi:hypothetical protein